MTTATISSKGQITIPANVRQALHVEMGDRFEFVKIEAGRYEFVAATRSVCSGQVISDSSIDFLDVDSRSKALGDMLPSFECSLTEL